MSGLRHLRKEQSERQKRQQRRRPRLLSHDRAGRVVVDWCVSVGVGA